MSAEDLTGDLSALAAEDMSEETDDRRRRILAFLLLAAIVAFVIWWILSRLVAVPDVVGLSEDKARETLEVAGFEVGDVTTTTVSVEEEAGKITDQNPDAGNRVLKGSDVDLVLAVLPGDGGRGRSSSYEGLDTGTGFDPSIESTDRPADYVPYFSEPILTGPQVPFVLNMTLADAKSTLDNAGYNWDVDYGPSTAGVKKGRVFYQNPEPEAHEGYGTVVNIWVSTGAPKGGAPYPQPD